MQAHRPTTLIGVLGTHTEVGKTFVASQWLTHLRQNGARVSARKPVQSFDPKDATTDARRLAAATGEDEFIVCPHHRRYPFALAPPMAADLLSRPPISLSELLREIRWPIDCDIGVVETVGGPRSPLAHDGDSIDLLRHLNPDVILLIGDPTLGALNAVRLSMSCLETFDTIVYLNRFDVRNALHVMNRQWLTEKDGLEVAVNIAELDARLLLSSTTLTLPSP